MPPAFWSNTVWYILLFLTSLITLIITLKKSPSPRFTIAFTAATLGVVFYIESILVIVLNAYSYYPAVVDDAFQDTVFGNFFSQLSISSTSAFALVYHLSFGWYFVFAAVYYVIELLFTGLKIYELHTYRSVYTLVGFAPLFMLISLWYRKLAAAPKRFLHYMTVLLGTNATQSVLFTLPLKVFHIQKFALHIFEDSSKDHTTTNLIYGIILTPLFILLYRLKIHWAYKVTFAGGLIMLRYLLYRAGIIQSPGGLFLPIALMEFLVRYGLIAMYDGFLDRKPYRVLRA